MRTNNEKVKNVIISTYFVLIVLAILVATLSRFFTDLTSNPYWTFIIITALFIIVFMFVHFISKYFEYDSDGMQVVITNKGLLLADHFNYREKKLEFEKKQLVGYRFSNYFIFRNLIIYTESKRGHKHKDVFNITLVNKKKRKYVRQSLSKIIKQNRSQKSTDS